MVNTGDYSRFTEFLRGRAAIYAYFEMALAAPPGEEFLGLSEKFLPVFRELTNGNGAILLEKYIETERRDGGRILQKLNTTYTTLFNVGLSSVPSTESVFRSPARLQKQEPWEEVMRFYHIRKYKRPRHIKEPEDHISVELNFMQHMCDLTIYVFENRYEDKIDAVLREQLDFLNSHLLLWVKNFCTAVAAKQKYDETGLYFAIAHLLPIYLEQDAGLLTELIN